MPGLGSDGMGMGSSLSEAEAGHCPWFMVRHSLPATKVDTSAYIPEFVLPLSSSHSPRCRRRRSSFVLRPPSRCVHPDILTNNFIDALLLAVCVWFLIVAQLRWTHVIIAHFMTHLSKCVPRSFPFLSSSLALAFRLSFVRGDFLQHAASDSRTSILLYPGCRSCTLTTFPVHFWLRSDSHASFIWPWQFHSWLPFSHFRN